VKLAELQQSFTAHIRDPERAPAPDGIEDRRMKIYRDLFFNNIQSLLASNFPVLRSLYDQGGWRTLVRDFYAHHRSRTPLFPEIAREFLQYLQDEREARPEDPPFLLELAHYEWVELALDLDERAVDSVAANPDGDLLDGRPVLNPLTRLLGYRFPVHRIRTDFRPTEPPPQTTHLLVYRNRDDDVKFMQLNAVTQHLLERLGRDDDASGREILVEIASEIGHADAQRLVEAGADLLADLRQRGVVLGTRPTA
jgi:hypothetical protein